jgi:hypothetical protein
MSDLIAALSEISYGVVPAVILKSYQYYYSMVE